MLSTVSQPSIGELASPDPRTALFLNMKGQIVHIPNLKLILSDWKGVPSPHINPSLEPLRESVSKRLRNLNFTGQKLKKLEASDFGLFTALWWPDTSFEKLQILAYLVIWLFTWDDELDEPTGAFMEDLDGGKVYRSQTLRFVGNCLGVVPAESGFRPQSDLVQSFDVVGEALREAYTIDQRRRVYEGVAQCMAGNEAEQNARLRGQIPTVREYWDYRLGTSLVYISAAVGEYSMTTQLPAEVMECDSMLKLWVANNDITWIINDVLSLRKEMKIGFTDSLIPIIFMTTNDAQRAMNEAVTAMETAKKRFDNAAGDLLQSRKDDNEVYSQLKSLIQVLQSNCVGALIWSLSTTRFGMSDVMNEDGSFTYKLGS
ncbi:isoprenoid synthase domain-containing protein [Camillea tinctor]|nr:isoprenoid synthase domain-containing protein [Camillea tinctor]